MSEGRDSYPWKITQPCSTFGEVRVWPESTPKIFSAPLPSGEYKLNKTVYAPEP